MGYQNFGVGAPHDGVTAFVAFQREQRFSSVPLSQALTCFRSVRNEIFFSFFFDVRAKTRLLHPENLGQIFLFLEHLPDRNNRPIAYN
jgi:hypothetical protein